jgi:hypothetical protein
VVRCRNLSPNEHQAHFSYHDAQTLMCRLLTWLQVQTWAHRSVLQAELLHHGPHSVSALSGPSSWLHAALTRAASELPGPGPTQRHLHVPDPIWMHIHVLSPPGDVSMSLVPLGDVPKSLVPSGHIPTSWFPWTCRHGPGLDRVWALGASSRPARRF